MTWEGTLNPIGVGCRVYCLYCFACFDRLCYNSNEAVFLLVFLLFILFRLFDRLLRLHKCVIIRMKRCFYWCFYCF